MKKHRIGLAAVAFAVALPVLASAQAAQGFAPEAAPDVLKPAVKAADEALATLKARMTARLMQELQAGGPLRAVNVCRDEAPAIAAEISRTSGVVVGRTSHRLRNAGNQPPAWAQAAVAATAGRKAADVAPVAFALGDRVGVLRPIAMAGPCARCHGGAGEVNPETAAAIRAAYPQDQATGFAEGDLRGFAWAEARVGAALAATSTAAGPVGDPLLAKGKALFAEANPRCIMCHTVEGKGNPASVLDGVGLRLDRAEIVKWLRDPKAQAQRLGKTRKPAMVPYPEFEDAEIEALAAYIASLPKP
ncbi:MAG: c-type cytochrome [Vicinamibacteria bacterium]|nr:c-type cytochrome [Vicinamibacteria bacterium]